MQETTKQLAKSLVFEKKLENDKNSSVGKQHKKTQQLLDYYNNKCFVDTQEKNDNETIRNSTNDLPYLNANSKVFNIQENPKYKNDLARVETGKITVDKQKDNKNDKNNLTLKRLTQKLKSNADSLATHEYYTPVYKGNSPSVRNFDLPAAGKATGDVHKTLMASESAEIKNLGKGIIFDSSTSLRQANTELKSQSEMSNNIGSLYDLDKQKKRTLKVMGRVNKNLAKLHSHTKANWSIADVPLKYITKPVATSKINSKLDVYEDFNSKSAKKRDRYEDFSGEGKLIKQSDLTQKIK